MKEEKIKNYLKKKENIMLLIIIAIATILRLKYFLANSTVWWDEAEYLSTALHWAKDIPYTLNPQRPILLPFLESFFLYINASEAVMRFFILFLPSLGLIFTTYLLGKEIFNKKTGLIAAAIIAVSWQILFNTTRLHVEVPLLFLISLSILYFWKGFIQENKKAKYWCALFTALAFLTKFTAILLIGIYVITLLITKREEFKKKETGYALGIGVLTLLPYFIWAQKVFGNPFAFRAATTALNKGGDAYTQPIAWNLLNFMQVFLGWFWLILFGIGVILGLKFLLTLDVVIKNKEQKERKNIFMLLFIIIFFFYFIFIQRAAEDRWLLPTIIPMALIIGNATTFLTSKIKKETWKTTIIIVILLIGIIPQIQEAHEIINIKKDSYKEVKDAAFFIKAITKEDEYILTASGPQTMYYTGRPYVSFGAKERVLQDIKEKQITYFTISVFEKHPDWTNQFVKENTNNIQPIQVYPSQEQPLLLVFEIINREALQ